MAATPKKPQKMRLDYSIDRDIYDPFVKACTRLGRSPNSVIEKLMIKFNNDGQL